MTNTAKHIPHDQRFNNPCKGDTLERFEWFEIMPCRNEEPDGGIVICEAGRANEGAEDDPLYLATAVHDAITPLEAVRIARQISLETGKGFVAGDDHVGQFPRRNGKVTAVAEFTEIAEDLTFAIHEDIDANVTPAKCLPCASCAKPPSRPPRACSADATPIQNVTSRSSLARYAR